MLILKRALFLWSFLSACYFAMCRRQPQTSTSSQRSSPSSSQLSVNHNALQSSEIDTPISYIDIVITVKTPIKFVRTCVNALLRHAPDPAVSPHMEQRVVFVDDGSPQDTLQYEHGLCKSMPSTFFCTSTSGKERGYTWAVEKGIHHLATVGHVESVAVVLLNSDTVVTAGWLASMLAALTRDSSTMIVGPLSNAATWQSVPHPQLADNTIPLGLSVDHLAREVKSYATEQNLPEVPIFIINGFCFMFKRELLSHIGGFDTANFGPGYGEEVDFCLRAHSKGYTAVIDPSTYIFHTKTASFPSAEKKELNLKAHKVLDAKYGHTLEKYKTAKFSSRKKLDRAIESVDHLYKVHSAMASKFRRPSILFVTTAPSSSLGDFVSLLGSFFYLKSQQMTVWMEVLEWDTDVGLSLADFLLIQFPDLSSSDRSVVFSSSGGALGESRAVAAGNARAHTHAEVIVTTSIETVPYVQRLCRTSPRLSRPVYLINDFPVLSSYATGREHEKYVSFLRKFGALNSSLTVLSRSQWVIDTASQENADFVIHKTAPSIDHNTFYISQERLRRKAQRGITSNRDSVFCIIVRFRGGSKAIDLTIFHSIILLLLQSKKIKFLMLNVPSENYILELCEQFKGSAVISVKDAYALASKNFEHVSYNFSVPMWYMAELYREADLFVDAFELTGWALQRLVMEVRACGCVMVLPTGSMAQSIVEGGVDECLVFETTRANKLQRLLFSFLHNGNRRITLTPFLKDQSFKLEYSREEEGMSFLQRVSSPRSEQDDAATRYILSKESFVYLALIGSVGMSVLWVVYNTFLRPSGRIVLYNRVANSQS